MWCRVAEVMIGCWLAMSPFIFAHPADRAVWWLTDFGGALAVIAFAQVSFREPLRRIHLLSLGVALWLVASGYWQVYLAADAAWPPPPAVQNEMTVAWLLALFAILPSRVNSPPDSWAEVFRREDRGAGGAQVEETAGTDR